MREGCNARPARGRRRLALFATLACCLLGAAALSACGGGDDSSSGGSDGQKQVRLGVFLLATANTYSQSNLQGVKDAVAATRGVKIEKVFDGKFDGQQQVNQVQDAAATGNYDAFIVFPNDAAAMASAVGEAADEGVKVVAAFAPIGPDPAKLEPQVPGVIGTVAGSPITNGQTLGNETIRACREAHPDSKPCKVMVLTACKACAEERVRIGSFRDTIANAPFPVKVVAEGEGRYLQDESYKVTQNVLQAHDDLDVLLTSGDQMAAGAYQAFDEAGIARDVSIVSSGASREGVVEIENGRWFSSVVYLPETEGRLAAQMAIDAVRGRDPESTAIDTARLSPIGPAFTQDSKAFEAQWSTG